MTAPNDLRELAKSMTPDIEQLVSQHAGVPYGIAVANRIQEVGSRLPNAVTAAVSIFTERERSIAGPLIDHFNAMAEDPKFWQRDTGALMREIFSAFDSAMAAAHLPADDVGRINLYQTITLNFADIGRRNPRFRAFVRGETPRVPVVSALLLLYAVGSFIFVLAMTPTSLLGSIGYGVFQLGYALLGAALFSDRFGILRLYGKMRVFTAGVLALLLGISLSTLG